MCSHTSHAVVCTVENIWGWAGGVWQPLTGDPRSHCCPIPAPVILCSMAYPPGIFEDPSKWPTYVNNRSEGATPKFLNPMFLKSAPGPMDLRNLRKNL